MLALLHKGFYKKKRRQQYWFRSLLCTRLETGQLYTVRYEHMKDENEFFKSIFACH